MIRLNLAQPKLVLRGRPLRWLRLLDRRAAYLNRTTLAALPRVIAALALRVRDLEERR